MEAGIASVLAVSVGTVDVTGVARNTETTNLQPDAVLKRRLPQFGLAVDDDVAVRVEEGYREVRYLVVESTVFAVVPFGTTEPMFQN